MENRFGNHVNVCSVPDYDTEVIRRALIESFSAIGIRFSDFTSNNVVIKPNLVMKKAPDRAATTHPAVLDALIGILNSEGIVPTIAESPGGVYNAQRLNGIYRECGIEEVAGKHDCILNNDVTFGSMEFPEGKTCKHFDIITPVINADVIIDLCKLKSHSLTTMSAAVKNLFGTVPGIHKFEMHSAYPDHAEFSSMIVDLCAMLCTEKKVISITDGIVGMEGEGPTGGSPKHIGALLVSDNPFASDVVAASLIGLEPDDVMITAESVSRGYTGKDTGSICVTGSNPADLKVKSFKYPSTKGLKSLRFFSTGAMGKFFMPRPVVTKKCIGCGVCAASCPQKTIKVENGRAKIDSHNCIRCYCCQELCPHVAIKIARNPIINIISGI